MQLNYQLFFITFHGRTGLNLLPSTCQKLCKISNIVAIKEASGDLSQIAKIASFCKDELYIYSGNDDQILPVHSLGGIGAISVLSNILPLDTHKMIYSFLDGDFETAKKIQINTLPITNALFSEVNPIGIKSALNFMGYQVGIPRLPLVEMSAEGKKQLKSAMEIYGLL